MLSVAKPLEARRRRSSARHAPRKQAGNHLIAPFAALSSVCVVLIARLLLLSFHKKQEDFFACWFVGDRKFGGPERERSRIEGVT